MEEKVTIPAALQWFFGVALRSRSYLNAVYLLLAFPLGIAYFVFLLTGWALGVGLTVIWIGLVILLLVLLLSFALSAFERQQAIHLLGAEIGPLSEDLGESAEFWPRAKSFFANKVTWTGMAFLLMKFPLGVASFVLLVTGGAFSFALIAAPVYYRWEPPEINLWYIDTMPEALLASLIGVLCSFLTLHAVNGLAWIWRLLAQHLLGRSQPEAAPA